MATVYFTNNAATGTGSFVAALNSAADGDVIAADPAVFPKGIRVDVQLSSAINLTKSFAFDGRERRVRLIAPTYTVLTAAVESGCETLEAFDFEFIGTVRKEGGTARYVRCEFYGNAYTAYLCAFFAGAVGTLEDCVVVGSRSGGVRPNASYVTIFRSTITGNVGDDLAPNSPTYAPTCVDCIVDVVPSTVGFVNPPPDDLTGTSGQLPWDEWNLHLTPDSPYSAGATNGPGTFDLDGNKRRVDGARGAFETIDADLFWIGKDGDGEDVATPSLESADGWATNRFATSSDAVFPSSVSRLYVGEQDVAFSGTWAPDDGEIIVGRGDVSMTFGNEVKATVGMGTLTYSGDVVIGDEDDGATSTLDSFLPVAPATLDARGNASAAEFVLSDGVTLKIDEGTFGALTMTGGELVVATRLTVADSLTLTGGNVTLNGEDALLYAASATLSGGTLSATVPSRGYFAVPSETDASAATFDGVALLHTDVNAADFRADTTGATVSFSWTADLPTTLEAVAPFSRLSDEATPGTAPSPIIASPTEYRLWTGAAWLTATAFPRVSSYWTVESWGTVKAEVADVAFNVVAWGLAPNITHTVTTEE